MPDRRQRRVPSSARGALHEHPASAAVPRDRLVALNQAAADFFADAYPTSWAATYVTERLGLEFTSAPPPTPATPTSPSSPTSASATPPPAGPPHRPPARTAGATDRELVAAGLASSPPPAGSSTTSATGSSSPSPRSAPTAHPEIHGFIARRNPDHDPARRAKRPIPGTDRSTSTPPRPTCSTRATSCSAYAETRALLAAGATPVARRRPHGRPRRHPRRRRTLRRPRPDGHRVHRRPSRPPRCPQSGQPPRPASGESKQRPRGSSSPPTPTTPASRPPTAPTGNSSCAATTPGGSSLTGSKDPAEMLHNHGARALRDALDAAPSSPALWSTPSSTGTPTASTPSKAAWPPPAAPPRSSPRLPPDQWAPHLTRLVHRTGAQCRHGHQRGVRRPRPLAQPTRRVRRAAERPSATHRLQPQRRRRGGRSSPSGSTPASPSTPAGRRSLARSTAPPPPATTSKPSCPLWRPDGRSRATTQPAASNTDCSRPTPTRSTPRTTTPTLGQTRAAEARAQASLHWGAAAVGCLNRRAPA